MSYRDYTYFGGLHRKAIPGAPYLDYQFDGYTVGGGTTSAYADPATIDCPLIGTRLRIDPLATVRDWDLLTLPLRGDPGNTLTDAAQTLAELDPPPDYVQVFVSLDVDATSGVNESCADVTGGVAVSFTLDGAFFPFGVTETTMQGDISYTQQGIANTPPIGHFLWEGPMRRPADGLTYPDNPDNLATDSLMPWTQITTAPGIEAFAATGGPGSDTRLNSLLMRGGSFDNLSSVRAIPWWINAPDASANWMCVL